MNQKTSNESVRFSPVALALVLLAFLGFLALRVHAEGLETETEETQQMIVDKTEEQRQLLKEMQEEHLLVLENAPQERLRVVENTTETQGTFSEQKSAFEEQRTKALETYRSLLGEKKNTLREKLEESKKERELKKEEYKAHLSLSAQVRVGQYVERIVLRMDTAIVRLEQIAKRMETRIGKIEEQGVDLSEAKVDLRNIYVLIEDAHEYVELIGDVSTEVLTSENPQEQSREIREAVSLAKDSIISIHSALTETVKLIKVSFDDSDDSDDSKLILNQNYMDGKHTFTGVYQRPNCETVVVTSNVAESYPEQITILLETEGGLEHCPAEVAKIDLQVEVLANKEAVLTDVKINGESIDWNINS